ncbi:MAG TPA: nuclease-related domain-containing protein [Candidatus Saccharimonadales bacterium]|nr:nuclease-related domain-containing protein [Candidatus Saccharimonadales bacterium]
MQQQDILANPAFKGARQSGEWWRTPKKIIGLSTVCLVLIVCAVSAAHWWGNRTAIVLTGGLLVFSISFVTVICRIVRSETENPFRGEDNKHARMMEEENVGTLLDALPENYAVLHDVSTGRGKIDHLVFRQDGAVFLIETRSHAGRIIIQGGQLRWNGQPLEKDFTQQMLDNMSWFEKFLKAHAVFEPWIHAAIVFTETHVEKHLNLNQVDVFDVSGLKQWLEQTSGNPRAAVILWPHVEDIKNELAASDSMHLACQPLLR